jgi:predicted phosphodiesterase
MRIIVNAAEVLKAFTEATCAPVLAVSGNVDDVPGAAQLLPPHRVVHAAGWKLLLVHIVAPGPKQKGMVHHPLTVTKSRPKLRREASTGCRQVLAAVVCRG